jgi:hypothetical protein
MLLSTRAGPGATGQIGTMAATQLLLQCGFEEDAVHAIACCASKESNSDCYQTDDNHCQKGHAAAHSSTHVPCHCIATCRAPVVYSQLQTNPTWTCFTGSSTYAHSNFYGNVSSWAHISTWATYYNTTAPTWYAWNNGAVCSTAYAAMCEIPVAAYACASSPPPTPPPLPSAPSCEWPSAASAAVTMLHAFLVPHVTLLVSCACSTGAHACIMSACMHLHGWPTAGCWLLAAGCWLLAAGCRCYALRYACSKCAWLCLHAHMHDSFCWHACHIQPWKDQQGLDGFRAAAMPQPGWLSSMMPCMRCLTPCGAWPQQWQPHNAQQRLTAEGGCAARPVPASEDGACTEAHAPCR